MTKADSRGSGRGRAAEQFAGALAATMPGQVRDVLVAVGDTVARGEPLVILEAMKMEMRVTAPEEGQVTNVLCAVGDVVDRGQRLIEIRTIDTSATETED